MKCTWVDCNQDATKPQAARDGSIWAQLCEEHDAELNKAILALDSKKILSVWVKAMGGAKLAVRRMAT